jgi:hypothetical protein
MRCAGSGAHGCSSRIISRREPTARIVWASCLHTPTTSTSFSAGVVLFASHSAVGMSLARRVSPVRRRLPLEDAVDVNRDRRRRAASLGRSRGQRGRRCGLAGLPRRRRPGCHVLPGLRGARVRRAVGAPPARTQSLTNPSGRKTDRLPHQLRWATKAVVGSRHVSRVTAAVPLASVGDAKCPLRRTVVLGGGAVGYPRKANLPVGRT